MAKRYSRLPTELLPTGTVPEAHALGFNTNVALLGAISEYNAVNKDRAEGPINSKAAARAAIAEARADFYEMNRRHG